MVGKATPDRGGPRKAPMELTPTSGEQERHNVTVITVGSKYEVHVRSPAPSLTQTLQIKREVKYVVKKLPVSFIRASVVYHASVIIASVCIQYIYVYNSNLLLPLRTGPWWHEVIGPHHWRRKLFNGLIRDCYQYKIELFVLKRNIYVKQFDCVKTINSNTLNHFTMCKQMKRSFIYIYIYTKCLHLFFHKTQPNCVI